MRKDVDSHVKHIGKRQKTEEKKKEGKETELEDRGYREREEKEKIKR